jgi:hypothetical protein
MKADSGKSAIKVKGCDQVTHSLLTIDHSPKYNLKNEQLTA